MPVPTLFIIRDNNNIIILVRTDHGKTISHKIEIAKVLVVLKLCAIHREREIERERERDCMIIMHEMHALHRIAQIKLLLNNGNR
jgi:hypothetical protein